MRVQRDFTLLENTAHESAWRLRLEALRQTLSELNRQLQSLETPHPRSLERGINLPDEVRRFEIELIQSALRCTNGHQRQAARLLGLKPTTLNAKMKHYGLLPPGGEVGNLSGRGVVDWESREEARRAA